LRIETVKVRVQKPNNAKDYHQSLPDGSLGADDTREPIHDGISLFEVWPDSVAPHLRKRDGHFAQYWQGIQREL
jgi:hypothetical protein